jgi:hypothetical protein
MYLAAFGSVSVINCMFTVGAISIATGRFVPNFGCRTGTVIKWNFKR